MADEYNNQNNFPPQGSNQQQYYPPQSVQPPKEEKASVGLAILSYLIPLAGLILFLTKKDDKPKTAKVCGKCALASVIINVVLSIIMYATMGAALFSSLSDSDDDTDNSYTVSANSDDDVDENAEENIVSGNTLGDYTCDVISSEICKDWEGKDAILITYSFTNNSEDAVSFDVALDASPYQNGIGLETAILDDETDIVDVDIKLGVTKEVKKAYLLRDTTSDIEIEITEFFSFSNDKIVVTVTL